MNRTFELKKGKLVFEGDKIIITDNATGRRRISRISTSSLILTNR